jgi:NADH:ubiquinone oxidoreductase subunit H
MRTKAAVLMVCVALLKPAGIFAQSLANTGYEAGTNAMEEVATQIAAYVPYVVNLCYALAGVVAVVGAISVYIAMNNEEQDVKKKIMMVVGACIFLIAAANALPLFFGITN